MTFVWSDVSAAGEVSLPEEFRRAIGLEGGDGVLVELVGNEIHVRTVQGVVARSQAMVREMLGDRTDLTVDTFLEWRRADQNPDE
jgi:AbrB family looped-hinge helix DNA binding protein